MTLRMRVCECGHFRAEHRSVATASLRIRHGVCLERGCDCREYKAAEPPFAERAVFVETNPEGCVCTNRCEFPCWQRIGLTTTPCCKGCAELEAVD